MLHNTHSFLENWFRGYVKNFYSADEQLSFHVCLKEEHTFRVVQYGSKIGEWLCLSPEQLQLAKIAALLHDVGRFKQYQTYRTFNDGLSVNHAELGFGILEEYEILAKAGLSAKEQDIVKQAVLYHNRRQLPDDIKDDCLLLSKITRDADKLDIFSMLVTDDKKNQIPQPPELMKTVDYSDFIIREILRGNLIKPKEIKTATDLMLFRLSWIFDINFAYSFSYLLEQKYIEKLIRKLPDTDDIQAAACYLKKYAERHAVT